MRQSDKSVLKHTHWQVIFDCAAKKQIYDSLIVINFNNILNNH